MSLLNDFAHLRIPFEDILTATNNFAKKNFIGEGDLEDMRQLLKGKLPK